jgi:hypothetical protein
VDAESELAAERNRLRLLVQIQQAREARAGVSIENRIKDAQRRAKARRMRIAPKLHEVRMRLMRGKEQAALSLLAELEADLDGVTDTRVA